MNLSIYNRYLKSNDNTYVYNTQYLNCIKFKNQEIEDVQKYIVESNDENLEEMGFASEFSVEEQIKKSKEEFESLKCLEGILNIMLIMTYNCNCCCSYCFEKTNINENITINDISATCEYINTIYNTGNYNELQLHFFGGEPTLEIEKIIWITK